MSIAQNLMQELQFESDSTRKLFEAIPEEHWDWKPHEKSMTLGQLASHLVEASSWIPGTCAEDEYVMDMESYQPWYAASKEELLDGHDKNLQAALDALGQHPDEKMTAIWRMKAGDKVVLEMPRAAVVQTLIIKHQVHHRGQLTVYLRLKDVPLPQVYGPTADNPEM